MKSAPVVLPEAVKFRVFTALLAVRLVQDMSAGTPSESPVSSVTFPTGCSSSLVPWEDGPELPRGGVSRSSRQDFSDLPRDGHAVSDEGEHLCIAWVGVVGEEPGVALRSCEVVGGVEAVGGDLRVHLALLCNRAPALTWLSLRCWATFSASMAPDTTLLTSAWV